MNRDAINSETNVVKQGHDVLMAEIDKKMKERQLKKLEYEIEQFEKPLPRILEVSQKIMVPVLLIVGSLLAVNYQIPEIISKSNKVSKDLNEANESLKNLQGEETRAKSRVIKLENKVTELTKEVANVTVEKKKAQDDTRLVGEATYSALDRNTQTGQSRADEVAINKDIARINSLTKATSAFSEQIYIQFMGDIRRAYVNQLRDALSKSGFKTPPAERVDRDHANEVRYFSDTESERIRAGKVVVATNAFFSEKKCPLANLEAKLSRTTPLKPSPIEIWLNHSCR